MVGVGGIAGTILGSVGGLFGGAVDAVVSRVIEVVQGFPIVLLAIAVVAIAGPSLTNAMLAVAVGAIPDFARVARSVAIQLRTREFVEAARSIGASEPWILGREILPNMLGSLVVIATFDGAQAVMYEAALSFLGLGVQPPAPSFGGMLSEAKEYLAIDALVRVRLRRRPRRRDPRPQPDGRCAQRLLPAGRAAMTAPAAGAREPVIDVRDLRVVFSTEEGLVRAVDGISFAVAAGEVLGVVGESGSGKTVTAQTVIGLTAGSGTSPSRAGCSTRAATCSRSPRARCGTCGGARSRWCCRTR